MLQIIREFHVRIFQLVEEGQVHLASSQFAEATLLISVCAESPLYSGADVDTMLSKVQQTVGAYLSTNVSDRWLVDAEPDAAAARQAGVPCLFIPTGCTAGGLAEFLLVSELEPLLRPLGMLCRAVEVRAPSQEPVVAELDQELIDRYESELDPKYRPQKRRSAPFSPRKEIAQRGFGMKNRWSTKGASP